MRFDAYVGVTVSVFCQRQVMFVAFIHFIVPHIYFVVVIVVVPAAAASYSDEVLFGTGYVCSTVRYTLYYMIGYSL